jgi:hypothetical protein
VLSTSLSGFNLGEPMIETTIEYKETKPFYYHSRVASHDLLTAEEEADICKSMQADSLALLLILSSSE